MSFGAKKPATFIHACPQCGKKNRVPSVLTRSGQYACGACHATIVATRSEPASGIASRALARIGPIPKGLSWAYSIWAAIVFIVVVSNAVGPENWWPGSLNLYLPQAMWALPAIVLIPWTLRVAPKWIALPTVLLACVFGPLMGFVWHPITPAFASGGVEIRVMQCNVKWAYRDPAGLATEVERQRPDLIQFQDFGGHIDALGPVSRILANWNIRSSGQYITASRMPMSQPQSVNMSFPGKDEHHCTRILLTVGRRQVALYNVHLLTPRWGLMSVRARNIDGMDTNVDARMYEAAKLANDIDAERIPVLLTGDLNAPDQALVCRTLMRRQLRDAFAEAGSGYGYSYGQFAAEHVLAKLHLSWLGMPYVRIDHILYSRQWTPLASWTGSDKLSDHVPVYADLELNAAAPGH